MLRSPNTIAIVGAGFSGTMLAINLLRHGTDRIILIERAAERAGRGLAYSTPQPDHMLNVRAANMSAYPDDPAHFSRWLDERDGAAASANRFVSRGTYGLYLAHLLEEAVALYPDRLTILSEEVLDVEPEPVRRCRLRLRQRGDMTVDHVVLAAGNLPPHDLPCVTGLRWPHYCADPWRQGVAGGLTAADRVLLLGTGLTAVDVLLSLRKGGFAGHVVALSRRGLAPRSHAMSGPVVGLVPRPATNGSRLVRAVRERAASVGWRAAVDELRPHTQDLWRRAGEEGQRRFLRHLRPYWDVHRHRLAPDVAQQIDAWRASGGLEVCAGKLVSASGVDDGVRVTWRPRGEATERTLDVARIINCTGPLGDLDRTDNPLLRALTAKGLIRPDPLHLGIDVRADGAVRATDGAVSTRISAVGPMTRGEAWEIIAVPDIRRQVNDLARRLARAHWAEGEGL